MVAGSCNIVASGVHQLDDGCTFVHGTICGTLNMVARIYQQDIFACILIALFQSCDGSIGQFRRFFVDVSMNIVGVQDRNVLKAAGVTCRRSGCAQTHGSNGCGDTCGFQEAAAGDKLFHGKTTSS